MFTLGIDIGSTTSKCVLLKDGTHIVAQALVDAGIGTEGPEEAFQSILAQSGLSPEEITRKTATGYGRTRWQGADNEISELTAHALGCHFLIPEARTVIDIGGQDAKVISLDEKGRMSGFVMNDKCAAGTGRCLEVMAGILKLEVDQLGDLAAQSVQPVNISSTCTVFAESEVISQLANGADRADVVAGICQSVAGRVAALAKRAGVRQQVCMSGGVARNRGVREALSQALEVPVVWSPMAQMAGALGAALHAWQKCGKPT